MPELLLSLVDDAALSLLLILFAESPLDSLVSVSSSCDGPELVPGSLCLLLAERSWDVQVFVLVALPFSLRVSRFANRRCESLASTFAPQFGRLSLFTDSTPVFLLFDESSRESKASLSGAQIPPPVTAAAASARGWSDLFFPFGLERRLLS